MNTWIEFCAISATSQSEPYIPKFTCNEATSWLLGVDEVFGLYHNGWVKKLSDEKLEMIKVKIEEAKYWQVSKSRTSQKTCVSFLYILFCRCVTRKQAGLCLKTCQDPYVKLAW